MSKNIFIPGIIFLCASSCTGSDSSLVDSNTDAVEPEEDTLGEDGRDSVEIEAEVNAEPDMELMEEPGDAYDVTAEDAEAEFVDPNEASPYGMNILRSVAEELEPSEELRRQIYSLLQEAGVTWIRDSGGRGPRTFTSWWRVEPEQGEWTWAEADEDLDMALSYGFTYVGYLGRPAEWARLDGSEGENDHPRDMDQFRTYVRAVVQRYGFGDGGKRQIRYWEVGNEPNNNDYYRSDPRQYLDLLMAAYEAVKAVDPDAKVILGGLGGVGLNDSNPFEEYIFENGASHYFDIFNFHAYGSTRYVGGDYNFVQTITLAKELAETYGFDDKPMWLTETGSNSDSDGDFESDPSGEERQADDLRFRYSTALDHGIDKVFWFKHRDPGSDNWWGTIGMLHNDLEPKPAYSAYIDMTGS
jgi:hypothetical protein